MNDKLEPLLVVTNDGDLVDSTVSDKNDDDIIGEVNGSMENQNNKNSVGGDDTREVLVPLTQEGGEGEKGTTSSISASSSRDINKKSVSFSEVSILEFPIIMGDNPAVSKGPPLTIDWEPQKWDPPRNIDKFEDHRARRRRHRRKLTISSQKRVVILIGSGYDLEDIAAVTLEMHKLKELRAESLKAQGLHAAVWEALSGAAETTGRTLRIVEGTTEVVGHTAKVLQQATIQSGKFLGDTTTTIVKGTGKGTIIAAKAVGTGLTEVGKGTGKVVVGTGKKVSDVFVGTGRVIGFGTMGSVKGIGKVVKGTGKLIRRDLLRKGSCDITGNGVLDIGHNNNDATYYNDRRNHGYHPRRTIKGHTRMKSLRRNSSDSASIPSEDDFDTFNNGKMQRRFSRSNSTGDLEEKEKEKEKEEQQQQQQQKAISFRKAWKDNHHHHGNNNNNKNQERTLKKKEKERSIRSCVPETGSSSSSSSKSSSNVMGRNGPVHQSTPLQTEAVAPTVSPHELQDMEEFLMALHGMDQETLHVIMAQEQQLAKGANDNEKERENNNNRGEHHNKQEQTASGYNVVTTV